MKKKDYLTYNKKKRTINLLIILIGIVAVMGTGFIYANRLRAIDDYAFSKIEEQDVCIAKEIRDTAEQIFIG